MKTNLNALYEYLKESEQIKIFHAVSQDLEVFEQVLKGINLKNIVDTQIAAFFLGNTNCIGLAKIVKEYLNIDLPKTETVSKWIKRPLSNNQLKYAAEDVYYLHEIYEILKSQLIKESKYEFFLEECSSLIYKDSLANQLNKNIKLTDSPFHKQTLTELISWREEYATKRNIPRTWILKDRQLKKICSQTNPEFWLSKEILDKSQYQKFSSHFKRIINNNEKLSKQKHIVSDKNRQLIENLTAKIRRIIHRISNKNNIPPEFLSNQKNIINIAEKVIIFKEIPEMTGWRGKLCNHSIKQCSMEFIK